MFVKIIYLPKAVLVASRSPETERKRL